MLKSKVMYRQFIHSVAFVNYKCCTCLRPLYLYFPDTPLISYATTLRHAVFGDVRNGDPTSLLGFSHLCVSHTRWLLILSVGSWVLRVR